MPGKLHLFTLGGLEIHNGDHNVTDLVAVKARALLVFLAVTGETRSREALAALFWGEMPEEAARANLRVALNKLQKSLGPRLVATRQTVAFDAESPFWLDRDLFAAGCKRLPELNDTDWEETSVQVSEALALYGGDFLDGFYVPDSPAFEEWALVEREYLRQMALTAYGHMAAESVRRGAFERAVEQLRRVLAIDPWREETHQQLMVLYARAGMRGQALRQYDHCRQVLWEELGLEPSTLTSSLHRQIKEGVWVWGRQNMGSLERLIAKPHNLPAPSTAFVGREADLSRIGQFLMDPACRLLTLVGPAGVGKTRLAQQVSEEQLYRIDMFPDGVFLVPLAGVEPYPETAAHVTVNSNPLIDSICEAFGIPLAGESSPQEQLGQFLLNRKILLLLDNFEHVLDLATWLGTLLDRTPGLKILVTSRERLNLYQEWVYSVDGLDYPPPGAHGDPAASGSVQLFVQAARRASPDFTLERELEAVVRICRIVEGFPLAIELASAWVRQMACEEIAVQIEKNLDLLSTTHRNVPDRHRSMRAAFSHSWKMLSTAEQAAFAQLSIFRGTFDEDAARIVAKAPVEILNGLAEKSLLQFSVGRYLMHELLRAFAAEQLDDVSSVAARHAAYYAGLVKDHEDELVLAEPAALRRIERESDNVRAAWRWAVRHSQTDLIADALEGLGSFYRLRGLIDEGLAALENAAAIPELSEDHPPARPTLLGRLFAWQGYLLDEIDRVAEACDRFEAAMELFQRTGAERAYANCLAAYGFALSATKEVERADNLLQEAIERLDHLEDLRGKATALYYLGLLCSGHGQRQRGVAYLEESVEAFRKVRDQLGLALAMTVLANVGIATGDYDRASKFHGEGLKIFEEMGAPKWQAQSLHSLGLIAFRQGDLAEAEAFGQRSLEIYSSFGILLGSAKALNNLAAIEIQRGNFENAKTYYETAIGEMEKLGQHRPGYLVISYKGLASLHFRTGEMQIAADYFRKAISLASERQWADSLLDALPGAVEWLIADGQIELAVVALAHALENPITEAHARIQVDELLATVRLQVEEPLFEKAVARGREVSLGALVALLLEALT